MELKLMICIPTRSRKERFFQCLYKAQQNVTNPNTRFHICLDVDDYIMNRKEVKDVLDKYGNMTYSYNKSESKIDAVNRCAKECPQDYDVLLLLSDDMTPIVKGFDQIIIDEMTKSHSDTDGCLWFLDGNEEDSTTTKDLNTILCVGKTYYNRFNYLYHPSYKSFFSDNESTEVGKMLGKITKVPQMIITHEHPLFLAGKKANIRTDILYVKNNKFWKVDEELYFKRKALNFDMSVTAPDMITDGNMDAGIVENNIVLPEINKPLPEVNKPLLSILIPTCNGREDKLAVLLKVLNNQIKIGGHENNVEIIQLKDNKEMKLGDKRNKLYQMANGYYSVQIDDDDLVNHFYIDSVITAIIKEKPDCIGYKELCIWDGKRLESSVFSLKYNRWQDNFDGYQHVRSPFYKCPIKTDIALQVEIPSLRFGEDHEQAKAIYPLLKTETFINDFMYIYQHSSAEKHEEKYGFTQKTQLV